MKKNDTVYVACHGPDGTLLTRPAGFGGPVFVSHALSELQALTNVTVEGSDPEWDGSPLRIEFRMDKKRQCLESSSCAQRQQRLAAEALARRLVTSEVWEILYASTKSLDDLIHQLELQLRRSANNNVSLPFAPNKGCHTSGDDAEGPGASYITTWNLGRHSWLSQDVRTSKDHPHPRDLKGAMTRIRYVLANTSLLGRRDINGKVDTEKSALPAGKNDEGIDHVKTAAEAQQRFALFLYHGNNCNKINEHRANSAAESSRIVTYALALQVEPGRVVETCTDYQKQRKLIDSSFLTPLRPPLALLMVNMARVESGSVVLDPFCGSGSLLWAASCAGAGHCIGSDVIEDIGSLAKTVSVTSSDTWKPDGVEGPRAFSQFSPEFLQCDVFSLPRVLRRSGNFSTRDTNSTFLLDAIITDPPYGLREDQSAAPILGVGEANGSKPKRIIRDAMNQQSAQKLGKGTGSQCYIEDYTGEELLQSVSLMMEPVFCVAVEQLKPGGRLVYLLPLFPSQAGLGLWGMTGALGPEVISILPCSPGLAVVSAERHRCQKRGMARAIVVMERTSAMAASRAHVK